MSDPNNPPYWLIFISILLAFKGEIKSCYTEMKTWKKEKLKEFWRHVIGTIVGISAIVLVSVIYYHIPVDFTAVFLGLFYNFEYSYVAATLNSVVIGLGVVGSWVICSETRCCIRVIKTGDCV